MGKLDMKKPTKGDEKIVKEAVTKKPYTKPIFREWEKAYAKQ